MIFDPELPHAIAETSDLAKSFFIGIGVLGAGVLQLTIWFIDWVCEKLRKKNFFRKNKK